MVHLELASLELHTQQELQRTRLQAEHTPVELQIAGEPQSKQPLAVLRTTPVSAPRTEQMQAKHTPVGLQTAGGQLRKQPLAARTTFEPAPRTQQVQAKHTPVGLQTAEVQPRKQPLAARMTFESAPRTQQVQAKHTPVGLQTAGEQLRKQPLAARTTFESAHTAGEELRRQPLPVRTKSAAQVQPCKFERPLLASSGAAESEMELHTSLQLLVYRLAWQFPAQLVLAPLAPVHCTLPEEPHTLLVQLVQAAQVLHRSLEPAAALRTLEQPSSVRLPL